MIYIGNSGSVFSLSRGAPSTTRPPLHRRLCPGSAEVSRVLMCNYQRIGTTNQTYNVAANLRTVHLMFKTDCRSRAVQFLKEQNNKSIGDLRTGYPTNRVVEFSKINLGKTDQNRHGRKTVEVNFQNTLAMNCHYTTHRQIA